MPERPADRCQVPLRRRAEGGGRARKGRGTALRPVGPLRSSVLLADLEAALAARLVALLSREPGVTRIVEHPEEFAWTDGLDGRDHLHLPLALVTRGDGDATFVDAMPRAILRRDPDLGGRRRRIELECRARGAGYEVWTDDEILQDRSVVQVLRVADTAERAAHALAVCAAPPPAGAEPPVLSTLARRLLVDDLRAVGNTWIGRSRLTGIPMALMGDLDLDPTMRMLVWRPRAAVIAAPDGPGPSPTGPGSVKAREPAT